jgi:centrosomal protein CEP70
LQTGKEHTSRTVLESIVKHFQTLFDVPSVAGVYPRMNDIYSKLGEVHNILKTCFACYERSDWQTKVITVSIISLYIHDIRSLASNPKKNLTLVTTVH